MDTDEEMLNGVTEAIIGCAFKVHNVLGHGFAERVYENALAHELQKLGFRVEKQAPINVRYDGIIVGDYVADLIVNDLVLVENKAVRALDDVFTAQCLNYLACTGKEICLLLNFGRKVEIKRFRAPQKSL